MMTNAVDELVFVGDDDALNMLNTVVKVDGELVDCWDSVEQLVIWLSKVVGIEVLDELCGCQALLDKAKALREITRALVEQRKQGKSVDVKPLNAFLHKASRWLSLEYDADQTLVVSQYYAMKTPEQVLAPLAEVAANLITQGDFNLVKHCEHEDCVLWFYDKTKSHKRRWCSMKVCGNRYKVMRFRKKSVSI